MKNWSNPGIDGITNFWSKKLTVTWTALMRSIKKRAEEPRNIAKLITDERTVLLPKGEDIKN